MVCNMVKIKQKTKQLINISDRIAHNKKTWIPKSYWKTNMKPIKIHFNFDTDGDGVKDRKDCQPFNPKKQDWDMEEAKERGMNIEYMHPDEYIRKTGLDPYQDKDYFEDYYDTEKKQTRPIKELSQIIKSPKKVTIPWVGEETYQHEGRHRAYAAKMAGQTIIPVIRPSLFKFSGYEREEIAKKFITKRFPHADKLYKQEWIDRFIRGNPEGAMDSESKKIYQQILTEALK